MISARKDCAQARMTVEQRHLNGGNVCQGGALFTLADLASAAACNSEGHLALSISETINFHKSGLLGDVLTADAHVEVEGGKLPYCAVRITNQEGEIIATFSGLSYRKDVKLPIDDIV